MDIAEAIQGYINDANTQYAFMISGQWGSGKTHLWTNQLSPLISKKLNRDTFYISLYDVNCINGITEKIILQKFKIGGNKAAAQLYGIGKIILNGFSSFLNIKDDAQALVKKFASYFDGDDIVICFDDIERTTLNYNVFWGYINWLVEHTKCKVILVSNEDELKKKTKAIMTLKKKQ
ncbi:MAG TPA: P-loop NTPase fold protein [Desulfovibrio sp.]|uniref:P-loop NTPase fold protein n=1 Tax=Desulfovibrio sp. TaxID=885 RepID=UPI002C4D56D7|nr:P-loop NTPase fold protein [Desulfovibrio sp.]HMM39835.1 P-loop NTPase fold protein [Desulfovibrio sp.]